MRVSKDKQKTRESSLEICSAELEETAANLKRAQVLQTPALNIRYQPFHTTFLPFMDVRLSRAPEA